MAIDNFTGDTFVAFIDISGLKKMMQRKDKALDALSKFYQVGYDTLNNDDYKTRVNGMFVSDCGILFTRRSISNEESITEMLGTLIEVVKNINEEMLKFEIMLTTSIAYGEFHYDKKLEYSGIVKNLIFGEGYLNAFLDNETGKPRIEPGQCRILKRGLPENILNAIETDDRFQMFYTTQGDDDHYYYYWSGNNPEDIQRLKNTYRKAKNSKFVIILEALKANGSRNE